jgi:hypothetical protein
MGAKEGKTQASGDKELLEKDIGDVYAHRQVSINAYSRTLCAGYRGVLGAEGGRTRGMRRWRKIDKRFERRARMIIKVVSCEPG